MDAHAQRWAAFDEILLSRLSTPCYTYGSYGPYTCSWGRLSNPAARRLYQRPGEVVHSSSLSSLSSPPLCVGSSARRSSSSSAMAILERRLASAPASCETIAPIGLAALRACADELALPPRERDDGRSLTADSSASVMPPLPPAAAAAGAAADDDDGPAPDERSWAAPRMAAIRPACGSPPPPALTAADDGGGGGGGGGGGAPGPPALSFGGLSGALPTLSGGGGTGGGL